MANGTLQVDTAFVVHLRSYAFFHSGRERLRTQVLKRVWEHIPGATLYGAVAAAMIRLDGIDPDADPYEAGPGGYHRMMGAVKAGQLRFTPLLPVGEDRPLTSARGYCAQALRLHEALYAEAGPPSGSTQAGDDRARAILHTGPHAPLDRATARIHGDQIFVLRTHRPLLDYYGFIFADRSLQPLLARAFRLFPMMPVGGRGKFSLVEAEIAAARPAAAFRAELDEWLDDRKDPGWVRLLTPLVLRNGGPDALLTGRGREMVMPGLRRYRVWRTGRYYDAQAGAFGAPRGVEVGAWEDEDAVQPGGRESDAVLAVPERSRFRLLAEDDPAAWFIGGVGNPSWTYLGWGQVVIE